MPASAVPEVPPGVALLEAVNELRAAETLMSNRARARMGLRASDYQAVQYIAAHDATTSPARPKDIMIALGVSAAAATIVADRLVQKNLITRTADPDDRRSRILSLTDTARTTLTEVFGEFPANVQTVLNDVPDRDVAVIRGIAHQVRELLDSTAA